MDRRNFIAMVAMAGGSAMTSCKEVDRPHLLQKGEILHSVMFVLNHSKGDPKEKAFLEDGKRILSALPSVRDFQVLRQVSSKCDFEFGFSMVFENEEGYTAYNNHPDHLAFVSERWNKEVTRFQEIDYAAY